MECKKCAVQIPSEFEYVLSKNVCPKCGSKLLTDVAMRMYIDLKKRLGEVEFVMDKNIVCERVAMFLITNYEVGPLAGMKVEKPAPVLTTEAPSELETTPAPVKTSTELSEEEKHNLEEYKRIVAEIVEEDADLSPEQIRAEEAARAQDIMNAREDVDYDNDLDPDVPDALMDRLGRLGKILPTKKVMGSSGKMGKISRAK